MLTHSDSVIGLDSQETSHDDLKSSTPLMFTKNNTTVNVDKGHRSHFNDCCTIL